MELNILDVAEIEKIEKRLSEKYKKPIEVGIKQEKDVWYNIERLTLEIKHLSITEIEKIAKNDKYVEALKELHETLKMILKWKI